MDPDELRELRADAARVSFLETLNARGVGTGFVVLRDSFYGRGWRLHEAGDPEDYQKVFNIEPKPTVREAIDDAMRRANENGLYPLSGD